MSQSSLHFGCWIRFLYSSHLPIFLAITVLAKCLYSCALCLWWLYHVVSSARTAFAYPCVIFFNFFALTTTRMFFCPIFPFSWLYQICGYFLVCELFFFIVIISYCVVGRSWIIPCYFCFPVFFIK